MTARATSAVTNNEAARRRRELRRPQVIFELAAEGARPKKMQTSMEMARVKSRARASMVSLGRAAGLSATRARTPQMAAIDPSSPPVRARSAASVSHCWMRRPSVAPRARRTAISFSRATARTNRRLATLAQAISRTAATAERRRRVVERKLPNSSSRRGMTDARKPGSSPLGPWWGWTVAFKCLTDASMADCAAGREKPGLRRASMLRPPMFECQMGVQISMGLVPKLN